MSINSRPVTLLSLASLAAYPTATSAGWAAKDDASATIYRKTAVAFRVVVPLMLVMLTLWTCPASAFTPPNVSYLEMAQESDVVLVGTVHNIRGDQAQFAVEQVLKGAGVARVVKIAPVSSRLLTMGQRLFEEGETLVLFLKKGAVLTIMIHGWAALTVKPDTKNAAVEAVRYLLQLPPRSDKDATARAMLALAVSDNFLLRREALSYIASELNHADNSDNHAKELIALLQHPETRVRRAALGGLQFRRSAEALPLIIEITRGDDLSLVETASMALAHYDTPEAVAALIALTRHANPDLRVRALIDLDDSRRPEAKSALIVLLDDPDPKVRALAPRGLVMWLRRGEAPEVVPKLIQMLHDLAPEVQVGAASHLGESESALAVGPLFDVLRRTGLSVELEREAMQSLAKIYSRLDETSRPPIADNLSTVITVMNRSRWLTAYSAAQILARIHTPESVAALRHATQNHPEQDVREYVKRLLSLKTKK